MRYCVFFYQIIVNIFDITDIDSLVTDKKKLDIFIRSSFCHIKEKIICFELMDLCTITIQKAVDIIAV